MRKILLSATVAAMTLATSASALEDIKVSGQAKLWYETNEVGTNDLFSSNGASGEAVFKLGVTGKQGNVGFGATFYQTSTMGLENGLVDNDRLASSGLNPTGNDANDDGEMYTGEMYITIPTVANTTLKIGKQELDTPLAFTERWNAAPNTFNAAVAINQSVENLTLVGAYVGQGGRGEVTTAFSNGAYAAGALYNNKTIAANLWGYTLDSTADAFWLDASMNIGPVKATAYAAMMDPVAAGANDTDAYALKVAGKVGQFNLMAAYSTVCDDGVIPVANTATNYKKTKLPTAGVYTDGWYVAQVGSEAFKVKASTKFGNTGVALQYVDNDNDAKDKVTAFSSTGKTSAQLETSEVDLIVTHKLGDVNLKAILMDRDTNADAAADGQYVRVIASVNF